MTKTRAVKWWVFRHNMYHLFYAFKHKKWGLVWNILRGRSGTKVIDCGIDGVSFLQSKSSYRGIPHYYTREAGNDS